MALTMLVQARGWAIIGQVAYADNVFLNLSRLDSIVDNTEIIPYQVNASGLQFRIDSPTENLVYNGLTVYATNLWGISCSSTSDIESIITQVWLYQSGALLGTDATVSATGVDSCIYDIPFTTALASGFHDFDIVFDTTWAAFDPEWSTISFVIDNTSFPWLVTDTGTGVVPGDISWWPADGADFTTQNPGIALIENIFTGASQVAYNNGYLTWFAVSLTSKSASDVILSWFVVGQIGTNEFGSGWFDLPHTISLLDTTGNVVTTTTINQSGDIIFENLNYLISAGQTQNLHMMISYTGNVVANNFQFEWSYWDVYDTSGHAYPYAASIPGVSIDILENTTTALNTASAVWWLVANDLGGIYVWQMRFSSTSPSHIEQIALININNPFYGTEVSSGTLACSTSSDCDNISTWWDGLTVYITHSGQVVSSGVIISGAVLLSLGATIPIYDQWDLIDIYVLDSDGIQQSDETNKIAMLWLLNTEHILDLWWQTIETVITADSNGDDLVANFDDDIMVYDEYRIRNSLLSTVVMSSLSWYKDINDVMYQTWVSLLWVQLQSTWSTSHLYQLIFNHATNVQVDNFGLMIDGDNDPSNAECSLNSWLVTCTMTGSYANGFAIDTSIHEIILTADITGGVAGTGDFITTELLNSTPQDYVMYDVDSIPVQHSMIHSDWSDPSLTPSSINWFTDAGITLSNISLEYNVWGSEWYVDPIIITGISYQHTGANYSFMWDSYNTGFVTLFIQNVTTSWSYIQQAQVSASSWIISPIVIWSTATYNIKFTPVTNTGASLWPDQIISLTHTGIAPLLFLIGNANPFVELWWFFFDAWSYWDDGITQWSDNIIVSGTVNTNQLWIYPITYDYTDSFGNPALQVVRTVTIQDTTVPVITISGDQAMNIEFGAIYTDAGATASDNSTGTVFDLVGSGTVDTMILWDYFIYYEYADPSGNTWYATRTVTVQDTTAPVISLIGDSTVNIGYNGSFSDSWATWTDARDGSWIVYTSDSVPNIIWSHTVTYSYQDAAGNTSTTINRTVNVIDNTIPIITLNGSGTITIEAGDVYIDSGALYNDDVAGVGPITASWTVNIFLPGSYLLTYDYTDAWGNTWVQQTREVTVVDTTAPVISIIGLANMTIPQWWVYNESWATWTDIVDGSGSTLVSWSVDTNALWTYYIEYSYTDGAGNTGSAIRTIDIIDLDAPSVAIIGSTSSIIEIETTYIDSWATWTDLADGSGSAFVWVWWATWSFAVSGSVNTSQLWVYYIQYQKVDSAGNSSIETREVTVVDTTAPIISIIGSANMTISQWWIYNESWAIWTDVVDGSGSTLVSWTVDTNNTWTYYVEYSYTDTAGNTGSDVRTVTVSTFCTTTNIPQIQCEALMALYNSTNGTNWTNTGGWGIDTDVENWYWIQLSGGNASNLNLSSNGLSGSIPVEIWNLVNLTDFDAQNNNLLGVIPAEIGNLVNLKLLGLGINNLSGEIPTEIWNLVNLDALDLQNNDFYWPIPTEIFNLTGLTFVSLRNNNFSWPIPVEIWNLSRLWSLYLNDNNFSWSIPSSIALLPILNWFYVQNNQLNADSGFNAILPAGLEDQFIASGVSYDLSNNYYQAPSISISPVWYIRSISDPNSYTITWTPGTWINKVEIYTKNADTEMDYTKISTILGTIWSGEINLYTWGTNMVKLTPVDDLSTPTGPDEIMTITHTISGSVSTGTTIQGQAWFETQYNGVYDSWTENTIDGGNVFLYECNTDDNGIYYPSGAEELMAQLSAQGNTPTNNMLAQIQTDYYGWYQFSWLEVWKFYNVRFGGISGFEAAWNRYSHNNHVCVQAGSTGIDFTLLSKAQVNGSTWFDDNNDAVQQTGENTVDGMNMYLVRCENNIPVETVVSGQTDYYGWYQFTIPASGSYIVTAWSIPTFSNPDSIENENCRSIHTASDSWNYNLWLVSAQSTVQGQTWFDSNTDGAQQTGENTVDGMNVFLYACNRLQSSNRLITQTQTDYYGWYQFSGVAAWFYQVRFGGIPGFDISTSESLCMFINHNETVEFDAYLNEFSINDPEFTDALQWMYASGLTQYNTEYQFQPMATITNEEAAQMINMYASGVYGLNNSYNICDFDNLETIQTWYRTHVQELCQKWLTRYNYWSFIWTGNYTKASLITALVKMMTWFQSDGSYISPRYSDYCSYAQENGITNEPDCFDLDRPMTKYELALMLYRGSSNQTITTQNYTVEWRAYFDDDMNWNYDGNENTVDGMNVYLYRCDSDSTDAAIASTTTDYYGWYTFTGLLDGRYKIKAWWIDWFKSVYDYKGCFRVSENNYPWYGDLPIINNYPSIISYQTWLQTRSQWDYVITNRFGVYNSWSSPIDTIKSITINISKIIGASESDLSQMISTIKVTNQTTNESMIISGSTIDTYGEGYNDWWIRYSADTPDGSGDYEFIDTTQPNMSGNHFGNQCDLNAGQIQIVSISDAKTPEELGQKVHYIETTRGKWYQCLNSENTGWCVDYQMRFRCNYTSVAIPVDILLTTWTNNIQIEAIFKNGYPQSQASYDMALYIYNIIYGSTANSAINLYWAYDFNIDDPYVETNNTYTAWLRWIIPWYKLKYVASGTNSKISGQTWFDTNGDNTKQTGENTVDGMNIWLYHCQNSGWMSPTNFLVQQTQTDYYGWYQFGWLIPWWYQVRVWWITNFTTHTTASPCLYVDPDNSASFNTYLTQHIIRRTGGWGWSSGRPPVVVIQSGSTTTTWDIATWSQIIPTKKQETGSWSDQVVSIQIGEDGRIIVIRPWDKKPWTDGRIFAKDLDKMWIISTGSNGTWGRSGQPIILKKYWIITPEMLQDPSILDEYEPTWDAAPRVSNRRLDPKLQSRSWDRDTTQETSSSFYRKIIVALQQVF